MAKRAPGYRDDLAYIHDAGFGAFAKQASPWLLERLRARNFSAGLVIDLGCGSGIWAEALAKAGYDVLGYDLSASMVELARQRVPRGDFHCQSFVSVKLRPCVAVTAIGEIFNYVFDNRNTPARLERVFRQVYEALTPGGLFIFDVALPGRAGGGRRRSYTAGHDWACLFEAVEHPPTQTLTRHITSFRKVNGSYRRDQEVHHLKLHDRNAIAAQLRAIGFRVRTVRAYGESRFPHGYAGFVARKP